MINFQTIRNKQKGLFMLIAIPVIIGFVILFTPDAEDRIFGRGNQSETGVYGQLQGETVTRGQWIEARNIVLGPLILNYGGRLPNLNDELIDNQVPNVLARQALMAKYGIQPSKTDSEDWVINLIDRSLKSAPLGQTPTRQELLGELSSNFGGDDQLLAYASYTIGVGQLQELAAISGSLVSAQEAQIKFRNQNEQFEAEALFLSHTNYLPLVLASDERIKTHYTNTLANNRIPERRQVSYVTFPATNYLDEAEKKFDELKPEQRDMLLQTYWSGITNLAGYKTNGITSLAKWIATVRTNKTEATAADIRSKILTTTQGVKSGLAVVEAYKAGLDFQQSLEATYKVKPALDTLEKMALLQNLTATTSPPLAIRDGVVFGLPQVRSAQVFALSKTNAFIIGDSPFSGISSDFYIASLKKVIPSRNRTFLEAKATVTADFKKAESIKLMNEAGEKIHQSIKDGKALEEVGKENNLAVTKLGPFDSVGGAIPGLANKANREDVRTQALGLDVGAISELITSSTDSSDLASEEAAFVVKLTGKNAVSKDRYDAEFAGYLKSARSAAGSQSYTAWLQGQITELYKYSLKTRVEGEGEIDVKSDDGDGGFYKLRTTVTLVAKPAANFVFKEWSGEVTGGTGNATNSVTVLRNSTVTATFVEKDAK
jgi:cephalosporin hydroxylase